MGINLQDYPGQKDIEYGTLKTFEINMETMPDKRKRTIRIWFPPTYDGEKHFPVLYMHDGQNLFAGLDDHWKWFVEKEMKKVPEENQPIIVAVDTAATRFQELCPPCPLSDFAKKGPVYKGEALYGDLYGQFIAKYLKPLIDETFLTKTEKEFTGVGGSSMGGLMSFFMAATYPDIFGRALCFSPALPVTEKEYIFDLTDRNFDKIRNNRFYFYDGGQTMDGTITHMQLDLYEYMAEKGMDYQHVCSIMDSREPHFESAWQKYFADSVKYLFCQDNSVMFPPEDPALVIASCGALRGKAEGEKLISFKGIPYAKAPVGELRWKSPQKPEPWEEIRECLEYGPSCYQIDDWDSPYNKKCRELNPVKPVRKVMSEDCLTLNIWTPTLRPEKEMPVMIWFYGGGLQGGTANDITFDGEGLCSYDVVLVTVNYRTGVFGYFGHEELENENEYHTSGNYGLQDQILALRWVKENIDVFGGDPSNITIFGCSGGGRSVQGLSCSPLSRGMIRHAICQSAGGLNPNYSLPYEKLKAYGKKFTEFCGCGSIKEMRQLSPEVLQKKYEQFGLQFNITNDGYYLPYTMDEMIRRGEYADIDYILSTMNDEIVIHFPEPVTLKNYMDCRKYHTERTALLAQVCIPETDEEAQRLAERAEVYEMKSAQLAWAKAVDRQGRKPVYLCTFDRKIPGTDQGAFHGADQYYVFHTLHRFWYPFTDADEQLSQRMMEYWTNFAKTGKPNGNGPQIWKPYTSKAPNTFIIDAEECEMQDRHHPWIEKTSEFYLDGER